MKVEPEENTGLPGERESEGLAGQGRGGVARGGKVTAESDAKDSNKNSHGCA